MDKFELSMLWGVSEEQSRKPLHIVMLRQIMHLKATVIITDIVGGAGRL